MSTDELLNAQEVAARLGVSAATVRHWALRGLIPAIRINSKVVRFAWDEVLAALRECGVDSWAAQAVTGRHDDARP